MKMPILRLAACLAAALILSACGDAKLDVTDADHFTASIQKMYDSVQGQEREDFLKYFYIAMNGRSDLITMSVLSDSDIGSLGSFFNVLSSRKRPEELAALSGLSVSELVDMGRSLKVTYLEGRLQEIQREMDLLNDTASFYRDYSEQLGRVELTPSAVAAPTEASGRTGSAEVTVTVRNGSDLPMVSLQRGDTGPTPWAVEVSLGESRMDVPVEAASFTGPGGSAVFPAPGIPAGQDATLTLNADVSSMDWPFPPEMPLKAVFTGGIVPGLEGWEKVFEAEDAYRRVMELERLFALLTRELADIRG
jgi:hypothetical protein